MARFIRTLAFLVTEIMNGIAVIGLIYCVTQDVTTADVIRWLS